MNEFELICLTIGLILTIFSFSYPFFGVSKPFSFAEHLGIGGTAAVSILTLYATFQGFFTNVSKGQWTLLIPIAIGALSFARLTKYKWLANYPIAIMTGVGMGLVFGTTITKDIISQIQGSISDFSKWIPDPISSVLMFFTAIFVMLYFFYSRRISEDIHTGRAKLLGTIARFLIFATLGNLYAKVLVYDGLDYGLTAFLVAYVRRSVDLILAYFGIILPF